MRWMSSSLPVEEKEELDILIKIVPAVVARKEPEATDEAILIQILIFRMTLNLLYYQVRIDLIVIFNFSNGIEEWH